MILSNYILCSKVIALIMIPRTFMKVSFVSPVNFSQWYSYILELFKWHGNYSKLLKSDIWLVNGLNHIRKYNTTICLLNWLPKIKEFELLDLWELDTSSQHGNREKEGHTDILISSWCSWSNFIHKSILFG